MQWKAKRHFRTEGGRAADPNGNFIGKPEAFRTEGGGAAGRL
ncbi:MAG TPA: hypothetical protein VI750_03160 [Pyrinomonadaceae bacterium]|nr:hypothetical protein [Pyrinomonadaceae bacterium]